MKETTILCATDVTTVGNNDVLHFCDKERLNIRLFETYSRKLYFLVALVRDAKYIVKELLFLSLFLVKTYFLTGAGGGFMMGSGGVGMMER